ncbi:MAG: hypothetical protein ACE5JH_12580 [Acidobacteriota bacterium]
MPLETVPSDTPAEIRPTLGCQDGLPLVQSCCWPWGWVGLIPLLTNASPELLAGCFPQVAGISRQATVDPKTRKTTFTFNVAEAEALGQQIRCPGLRLPAPVPVLIERARVQALRRAIAFQPAPPRRRAVLLTALETQIARARAVAQTEQRRALALPLTRVEPLCFSCCWPFGGMGCQTWVRNLTPEVFRICFPHLDPNNLPTVDTPCPPEFIGGRR